MINKDLITLVITGFFAVIVGLILNALFIKSPPLSHEIDSMEIIEGDFLNIKEVRQKAFPEDSIDTFENIQAAPLDN